jgi:hypothetical protein
MASPLKFVCVPIRFRHNFCGFSRIHTCSYSFGERRPPDFLRGPLAVPYGCPAEFGLFPISVLHGFSRFLSVSCIFLWVPHWHGWREGEGWDGRVQEQGQGQGQGQGQSKGQRQGRVSTREGRSGLSHSLSFSVSLFLSLPHHLPLLPPLPLPLPLPFPPACPSLPPPSLSHGVRPGHLPPLAPALPPPSPSSLLCPSLAPSFSLLSPLFSASLSLSSEQRS